jgi:ERCC4-type nuclease
VAKLKDASPEEIQEVKGIGPQTAATIHERLRGDREPAGRSDR